MKITRDKALEITALCRKHGLKYVGAGGYGNSVRAGLKAGTKAPNGVHIHFPRDWVRQRSGDEEPCLVENPRVYVLWFGESKEAIEEACAYLAMVTREKEIYVVRCNENISKAAEGVESCES